MSTIKKVSVPGIIVVDGSNVAIRLLPESVENRVYLLLALVTQGPGYHVIPTSLLDDWGNEVKPPALYGWVKENGLRFPRAEVFGFSPDGSPAQYFLRDLELFGKFPIYAFTQQDDPEASGLLVNAILIPSETVITPHLAGPPEGVEDVLRQAQVAWWQINPQETGLGFLEFN